MRTIRIGICTLVAAAGCSAPVTVEKPSAQRQTPAAIVGITATHTVSQEQAIEIACRAMGVKKPDSFLNVLPPSLSDSNQPAWRVQYAHPLGGNWHVKVDARTGEVLEKGEQPSR